MVAHSIVPFVEITFMTICLESDCGEMGLGFLLYPGVPVDSENETPPIPGKRNLFTLVT